MAMAARGASLAGTGPGLMSWMFGFCSELQKAGLFDADECKAHGVSGGATCAAYLAAGVDMSVESEAFQALHELSAQARAGQLGLPEQHRKLLRRTLREEHLPRVNGRLHVCLRDGDVPLLRALRVVTPPVVVSSFSDRDELIEALLTASHIPYALDGTKARPFRGRNYMDYGPFPQNFAVGEDETTVHVNVFPGSAWDGPMPAEPLPMRWLVRLYGKLTNLAGAPVDVHPWLVPGWSLFNVMRWDDLRLRPLALEDLLERHRFGRESFHAWVALGSGGGHQSKESW